MPQKEPNILDSIKKYLADMADTRKEFHRIVGNRTDLLLRDKSKPKKGKLQKVADRPGYQGNKHAKKQLDLLDKEGY